MAVVRTPTWTDQYYRIVEHYFWSPQRIGRQSCKDGKPRNWKYWQAKLENQETPLNHIVDIFFHVAPTELLDRIATKLISRPCSGLQLVHADAETIDANVVQPDIVLFGPKDLVFLELKVDSKSSVDQLGKYAIAANCICLEAPNIENVDLILVTRDAFRTSPWKRIRFRGEPSLNVAKDEAIRGFNGDADVWNERGIQRYLNKNPDQKDNVVGHLSSMDLHLGEYRQIAEVLQEFMAEEPTLERLIQGVLAEFKKRELSSDFTR